MLVAARAALVATAVVMMAAGCTGGPASDGGTPSVVVTTPLAGALAKAAGATDVTVVPDASPRNLKVVADADFVVYADSDQLAGQFKAAVRKPDRLLPVTTTFTMESIDADVTRLAGAFGTGEVAREWLTRFLGEFEAISHHLRDIAPIPAWTAVVDTSLSAWADFAGLAIVDTFGPGPVEPGKLAELEAKQPNLVLSAAVRAAEAPRVGRAHQVTMVIDPEDLDLYTVLRTNASRLGDVFAG